MCQKPIAVKATPQAKRLQSAPGSSSVPAGRLLDSRIARPPPSWQGWRRSKALVGGDVHMPVEDGKGQSMLAPSVLKRIGTGAHVDTMRVGRLSERLLLGRHHVEHLVSSNEGRDCLPGAPSIAATGQPLAHDSRALPPTGFKEGARAGARGGDQKSLVGPAHDIVTVLLDPVLGSVPLPPCWQR